MQPPSSPTPTPNAEATAKKPPPSSPYHHNPMAASTMLKNSSSNNSSNGNGNNKNNNHDNNDNNNMLTLTPTVRDACLKAMHLYSERHIFERFYVFCQTGYSTIVSAGNMDQKQQQQKSGSPNSTQNQNKNSQQKGQQQQQQAKAPYVMPQQQLSQGQTLALSLLLTRLFVAFSKRKQSNSGSSSKNKDQNNASAAATKGNNNNAPTKVAIPSSPNKRQAQATAAAPTGQPTAQQQSRKSQQPTLQKEPTAVYVQSNFAAQSTNVELSPKVGQALYRIVNDLAAAHALLPQPQVVLNNNNHTQQQHYTADKNNNNKDSSLTKAQQQQQIKQAQNVHPSTSWTGWSVAAICVVAHDFVLASLNSMPLRKAWKFALQWPTNTTKPTTATAATRHWQPLPPAERDMFFIFCQKVTEWMAGRCVRTVEAYQDYALVWHHVYTETTTKTLSDDGASNSTTQEGASAAENSKEATGSEQDETSTDDNKVKSDAKASTSSLSLQRIPWEPEVPAFGKLVVNQEGDKMVIDITQEEEDKKSDAEKKQKGADKTNGGATNDEKLPDKKKGDAAETSASKPTKDSSDAKGQEVEHDEDDDTRSEDSSQSPARQELRARKIVWHLSVFYSLYVQELQEQRIPSRRQRLIAGSAAVSLLLGLVHLSRQPGSSNGNNSATRVAQQQQGEKEADSKNDKGEAMEIDSKPTAKPDAKMESSVLSTNKSTAELSFSILDMVLTGANQECAFTRWACLDRFKISQNLTFEEVKDATLRLAVAINAYARAMEETAETSPDKFKKMVVPSDIKEPDEATVATMPQWLQELHKVVNNAPAKTLWTLPTLAIDLCDTFARQLRQEKIKVEASFYYDETVIVESEQHLEILCRFLDRPLSNETVTLDDDDDDDGDEHPPLLQDDSYDRMNRDTRATAVAARMGGMSKRPFELEERAAKRRKREMGKESTVSSLASPVVIAESMELTEWTVALLCVEDVKPSTRLRQMLEACTDQEHSKDWANLIIPNLNATLLRLTQEGLLGKTTRKGAVSVQTYRKGGEEDVGSLIFATGEMTHEKALCRALVVFYYHALECILNMESKRLFLATNQNKMQKKHSMDQMSEMVMSKDFHCALLSCCVMCVVKAVGTTHKLRPGTDVQSMQVYQALLVCESNPFEFQKVSEFFVRCLSVDFAKEGAPGSVKKNGAASGENSNRSPLLPVLPQLLKRDFERSEFNLLESLLWARDPRFGYSLPDRLEDFQEHTEKHQEDEGMTWWPVQALHPSLPEEIMDQPTDEDGSLLLAPSFPTASLVASAVEESDVAYEAAMIRRFADYKNVCRIIEKILRRSYQRIVALCSDLDIPSSSPLVKNVWVAFRYMMRNHIDLLNDRHIDHWILCSLYGVARQLKMEPEVKFAKIIDAYISIRGPELGDVTCQRIVRNIKIKNGSAGDADQWGNIITLYNQAFVPAMKDHLIHSKALEVAAKETTGQMQFALTEDP